MSTSKFKAGVTLQWTSIPTRGDMKYSLSFHTKATKINSDLMGHYGSYTDLTLQKNYRNLHWHMMQDAVPPDLMMAFPSESELPDLFHLFPLPPMCRGQCWGLPRLRFPFLKCLLGHCSECPLRCSERFFCEIKKKKQHFKACMVQFYPLM